MNHPESVPAQDQTYNPRGGFDHSASIGEKRNNIEMEDPLRTLADAAKSIGDSSSSQAIPESTVNEPPKSQGMKRPPTPDLNISLCEPDERRTSVCVTLHHNLGQAFVATEEIWVFQPHPMSTPSHHHVIQVHPSNHLGKSPLPVCLFWTTGVKPL